MIRIPCALCRLYYNKSGDPQKTWSLDFGEDTPEILLSQVIVCASGVTAYDAHALEGRPKGWLEFHEKDVLLGIPGLICTEIVERGRGATLTD